MRLHFIAIFASVRKHEEEKKKKRRKQIKTLATRISEMAGAISFTFCM